MLFLLNDVLLKLDRPPPRPSRDERRFAPLNLDAIIELACELFSEQPDLQHTHPERAHRLAWLLARSAGGLNAALFTAPQAGCEPSLVEPRFCTLPQNMLDQLSRRAEAGQPLTDATDKDIWGLVAA